MAPLLWLLLACSDKRIPDGLVPPPRPASTVAAEPKDVGKWLIRATGAEAARDHEGADEAWAWVHTLAPDDALLTAKYARYLVRTGRPTEALTLLGAGGGAPLGDLARGEALLALGRGDEATGPLQQAGAAGLWEAWVKSIDARLVAADRDSAVRILTEQWTAPATTATEARARALRRVKVDLDATEDLLLGVTAPNASPEDGLLLVTEATTACRLAEVRVVAARLDWAGQATWAPVVAALDHAAPCVADQAYAPSLGGP